MQERGLEARHVLLMESVWKADPLTGIRERMDKCTCSACGAVRYEWRGEYENRTMTGCDACGAHCMAVRKRNGKLPYEADGSLLWFHRHKDTAVAQGYEVNYWVGNDAVEHWAAVPSHIYAWGPYGDYAFNCYQSWCMGRQRAYLDQWYAQARMLDNWPFRGVPVLMAPEEGALNGTPLENARLRGYAQAKQRCLYPVRLATIGRRLPVMEGFCDFEDWDTVLGICAGRITLKRGETKPHRALGLTRPEYDRYRAEDWPWDWLPIYAAMKRSGYAPGLNDLQQIVRVLQSGGKLEEIERLEPGRLAQVWRYLKRTARRELDRQMRHGCGHAAITEEEALRHTLNMWLDYRRLAAQAGAANHPDRDSAMPYDLFARHDRLVEAQKEKDGTYIVSVKVKPITLFTDTYDLFLSRAEQYAKEVTDHVTKGAQMPTDEEMQEKIYQIYYEVLKEQAEVGMLYGRAEDVVLHIEKEGRGNYGIRQKDMKKLDGLLMRSPSD